MNTSHMTVLSTRLQSGQSVVT